MCAYNVSGHGIGCQAVGTPYIYIATNIQDGSVNIIMVFLIWVTLAV